MDNLIRVCNHLNIRSEELNLKWRILRFFPTRDGNFFWNDEEGEFWRLFNYIPHAEIDTLSGNMLQQAGKAYGYFIKMLSDLPGPQLFETIPHFHDMGYRLEEHALAINEGNPERISEAGEELDFIRQHRDECMVLSGLITEGKIPRRVTHNDAKMDNILFNSQKEIVSVIDLDTVMNGTIHSDFGDAMRSMAASAKEDEKEESRIFFRMDIYKGFLHGFLKSLKGDLTSLEVETLVLAPSFFAFMQGVRFLNDYLMNDNYYRTDYPLHNLVRARNQFSLFRSMKKNEKQMREIIASIMNE